MNVCIIGGDGYIGSHIVRLLVEKGHAVTVFGPGLNEGLLDDVEGSIRIIEGDIMEFPGLFQALAQSKAQQVIHLAAFGEGKDGLAKAAQKSPKKALDVNVTGFYHVLEAAKLAGVSRMIWSSSSTVYGPADWYDGLKVTEKSAVHPELLYGSTKVMDELLARYYRKQYGMDIVGIRLPLIFGPGKWYKGAGAALVDIFEQSRTGKTVLIQGRNEPIDLMYVKDAARLFVEVAGADGPLSDIYNVKSYTISLKALADLVQRLFPDSSIRFETVDSGIVYPLMDDSLLQTDLAFQTGYSLEEACKDYMKDFARRKSK